jgi:hypothetical protein
MMKLIRVLPLALILAGCGTVAPLRPPKGEALPVKPALAQTTPTADDLLNPPANAHPERIDELMKKSMSRKADRFDLPPPDGGAAPLPETQPPSSTEQPTVTSPR